MKAGFFSVPKEKLDEIQRRITEFNAVENEKAEQAKRNGRELAQLNRKCTSISKSIGKIKKKKIQSDADHQEIVRLQRELDETTNQARAIAPHTTMYVNRRLKSGVIPVWLPVGEEKVLMNWRIVEPLNRLLRDFRVEISTNLKHQLVVRYYAMSKRTSSFELRGQYTLQTLLMTPFAELDQYAPTCTVADWVWVAK